jgi:hypothetical protein
MSTGSVATGSIYNELQQYFQTRTSDQESLGKSLQSGDLAGAQQEYNTIQTLGQSGPFANGNAYIKTQREQDFTAVGQALQAGDLAGAQQAFAQFKSTFQKVGSNAQQQADQNPAAVVNIGGSGTGTSASGAGGTAAVTTGSTAATNGSEVVLNLGTLTPGEQITIGVSVGANGGEQFTVGITNPTASTATAASGTGATAAATPGPTAATNESQVVLNLGTVTPGEQITIGVSNGSNGAEQLSVGAIQPGQTPEQITLNLSQTANQEIILNLFNSAAANTSASNAVNVSA